ncbi:MAG: hypothetical protein J6Y94_01205 [Bacteriovoracaceae bacterium]|nr:hypothetical protein [Bacteriovoracaceae bacterium]
MDNKYVSGGISGAITSPFSDEAQKHAEMYYEEIRHFTTDVQYIAQNTGYAETTIALIKDYLFIDKHQLSTGFKRFEASFEIAESWRRMAFDRKNIKYHDLLLLQHELEEISWCRKGMTQDHAHIEASKKYDYTSESRRFYNSLAEEKENNIR